jgi:hypothetical protein
MYGKRRVTITKKGQVVLAGKYQDGQGGSYIGIGRIETTESAIACYYRADHEWKFVGLVKTKLEAKIAIFNAAKTAKHWLLSDEQIDAKGVVSRI